MELAAEPKEDTPVNPVQSEAPLCSEHGYGLKHYHVNCDEVVCVYCTMKEHIDHHHDMLNKWPRKHALDNTFAEDESDVQSSDQVRKKRKIQDNCSDSCECTSSQPVRKLILCCEEHVHATSSVSKLRNCTMSNPVVIGDPVKLTVTLKDACGSPVTNQTKCIEISNEEEEEFIQNVHIDEQPGGRYIISYHPKRKEDHLLSVSWTGGFHGESKVLVNLRDYSDIKQEIKIIHKYSRRHLTGPYLLAKGPNNEIIVRSTKKLVVYDKHLHYSHVIGKTGKGCANIFKAITGIAVDNNGYLYVADRDLHLILKFTLNGMPISIIGSEGTADGQFRSPYGLLLTQSQELFVCDFSNHRIQVFKDDQFLYCFGCQGSEPGTFNYPIDLTMNNSEDQLYVTDCSHKIQVFTAQGQFLKVFGCNLADVPYQLRNPIGIHYTPDGHLLVSSYGSHCVMVFKEDGKLISTIEGTYQGRERFSHPCGVVMLDNGQIVIAGSYNRLVVF